MKRSRRGLVLALALSACASLDRDAWQQPDAVIALLGVDPGDVVMELGPGDGYFTFRLAEAVGKTGLVLGIDPDDDVYSSLKREARKRGAENVSIQENGSDFYFFAGGHGEAVDLLFACNIYHRIPDPTSTFRTWLDHLAPNGRVAIIEDDGRGGWLARAFGHYTDPETIEREMHEAGYERIAKYDLLDRQSFQIFRADDGTGE